MPEDQNIFLKNLREEKLLHKRHRTEFVKLKLAFTTALFGLGSLKLDIKTEFYAVPELLLLVPLVALAFDVYIFGEDFKVKRIGIFLRKIIEDNPVEEWKWEKWLKDQSHRERTSLVASTVLTISSLMLALIVLLGVVGSSLDDEPLIDIAIIHWWFVFSAVLIAVTFEITTYLRFRLVNSRLLRLSKASFLSLTLITFLIYPAVILFLLRYDGDYFISTNLTVLLSGLVVGVFFFILFRIMREIMWRHRSCFVHLAFSIDLKNDDCYNHEMINKVLLCGEFTDWDRAPLEMQGNDQGKYSKDIMLQVRDDPYSYKILLLLNDGSRVWRPDNFDAYANNNKEKTRDNRENLLLQTNIPNCDMNALQGALKSNTTVQTSKASQTLGVMKKFLSDVYF